MGKKKLRSILSTLIEVNRIATMKTSDFNNPIEELPKSNEEVTGFIRKRTKLWRQCWIITPLEGVIEKIENELKQ